MRSICAAKLSGRTRSPGLDPREWRDVGVAGRRPVDSRKQLLERLLVGFVGACRRCGECELERRMPETRDESWQNSCHPSPLFSFLSFGSIVAVTELWASSFCFRLRVFGNGVCSSGLWNNLELSLSAGLNICFWYHKMAREATQRELGGFVVFGREC